MWKFISSFETSVATRGRDDRGQLIVDMGRLEPLHCRFINLVVKIGLLCICFSLPFKNDSSRHRNLPNNIIVSPLVGLLPLRYYCQFVAVLELRPVAQIPCSLVDRLHPPAAWEEDDVRQLGA